MKQTARQQVSRKTRLLIIVLLLISLIALLPGQLVNQNVDAISLREDQAEAVLSHLSAVLDDLMDIETLLSDQQLGLFIASDDDNELTIDQMQNMIDLARQYQLTVDQVRLAAEIRPAPELQPLQQGRTAKLAMLALVAGMLAEYEQVMLYSISLMVVADDLSNLPEYDELDEVAYFEAYSLVLVRSAELLASVAVPSYLQIMNDRLVNILLQMNDALYYSYLAVALNDPVRLNASDYHLDIIMRRFNAIMVDLEHDVSRRREKLIEDADAVERVYAGLRQWVQDNIRQLERR